MALSFIGAARKIRGRVENLDFIGISAQPKQTTAARCVNAFVGAYARAIGMASRRIARSCRREHARSSENAGFFIAL
jgi:hypothetical protein